VANALATHGTLVDSDVVDSRGLLGRVKAKVSTRPVAKVSGWGVHCYDFTSLIVTLYYFLLHPMTPSASCSRVDALNTLSSKLPPSLTVSRFVQPV